MIELRLFLNGFVLFILFDCSNINIFYSPNLVGLSVQLPLDQLCVVFALSFVDVHCLIAEGMEIVLL
jgi:hypothetical protein